MPIQRFLGPLPESDFVVAARDTIPEARVRVTTASTRQAKRGRGMTTANTEPATHQHTRGRRGRGRTTPRATTTRADEPPEASARPETRRRGSYNTAPGSMHHLLFGSQQQREERNVTDLNAPAPE